MRKFDNSKAKDMYRLQSMDYCHYLAPVPGYSALAFARLAGTTSSDICRQWKVIIERKVDMPLAAVAGGLATTTMVRYNGLGSLSSGIVRSKPM